MKSTKPPDKPPDIMVIQRSSPNIEIDCQKALQNKTQGPKFLVMQREDPGKTLEKVSPFLIRKAIDTVAEGEVEMCKKLKNGALLIKTKTYRQATKIIQITRLNAEIKVKVTEHEKLNTCKGVIYTNELRDIPETEICYELKGQNVTEVKKILKLRNNILTETGLHILAFATITLPEHIQIGYEKTKIQPYIPPPLRCKNCLHFGHTKNVCKKPKICANCGLNYHMNTDKQEACELTSNCTNCNDAHNALDNRCPIFIKQKEIQAIITIQKIDRKSAHKVYNERHPNINIRTYASTQAQIEGTSKIPPTLAISQDNNHTKPPTTTTTQKLEEESPNITTKYKKPNTTESNQVINNECTATIITENPVLTPPKNLPSRVKRLTRTQLRNQAKKLKNQMKTQNKNNVEMETEETYTSEEQI